MVSFSLEIQAVVFTSSCPHEPDIPIVDPVTQDDQPTDPPSDPEPGGDDAPLGPKGEKALEALKEDRRKLRADLAKAQSELDDLRRSQMDDQEKAIEDARRQARQEALEQVNGRLFAAEVRAAATQAKLTDKAVHDLLVDTAAAVKLLGLDGLPVTDDGDIDGEAISQAVATYAQERPYLAANATSELPPGDIDQGARTTPNGVKTLDEQIAEAEAAGDFKRSLALKNEKLAALPRP